MNATHTSPLSNLTRAAVALGAVTLVAAAWMQASHASHVAVEQVSSALTRTYVTLPSVEVVGRREAASTATAQAQLRRHPA